MSNSSFSNSWFNSSKLTSDLGVDRHPQNDWVYLQAHLCGRTCQNGTLVTSLMCTSLLDCFPCDCDDQCELFGTCCPVYDKTTDTYHYAFESSLDRNPHQWYNRLDCRTPSANDGTFLAVVGCPESWLDQDVKEKCEKPNKDSMEAVTPFSDKATGLVFTNAFCAICNGHEIFSSKNEYNRGDDRDDKEDVNNDNDDDYVSRIFPWKLEIECPQFQTMYTITDQFEFYKALKGNGCKYEFKAPFGTPWTPRRCDHRVLTDLNTSQLENYNSSDRFFGNLCHTLPPIPALTIKGNRNMFCFLALMGSLPEFRPCEVKVVVIGSSPFSLGGSSLLPPTVLLFRPALAVTKNSEMIIPDDDMEVACPPGFWRNDENNCTKAVCTPGKLLDTTDNSSTCKTSIPDVRGLGYDVNIILAARTEIYEEDIAEIEPLIKNRFSNISSTMSLDIDYFARYCPSGNQSGHHKVNCTRIVEIHISGYIIAAQNILRDTFEEESLSPVFQSPWELRVQSKSHIVAKTVSLQIVSAGQGMATMYASLQQYSHEYYCAGQNFTNPSVSHKDTKQSQPQSIERVYVNLEVDDENGTKKSHSQPINTFDSSFSFDTFHLTRFRTQTENITQPSQSFEKTFINLIMKNSQMTTKSKDATPPHPTTSLPVDDFRHIKSIPSIFPTNGRYTSQKSRKRALNRQNIRRMQYVQQHFREEVDCFLVQLQNQKLSENARFRMDDYSFNVINFRSKFIEAVPTLSCPYVETNFTGFSKLNNGSLQFTLFVHNTELNITFSTLNMFFEKGNLFLCLDFFRGLTDNLTTKFNPTYLTASSTLEIISYYMDVACISISILCLVFTFLTYSLFPTLRSLPGRNNMCLCISLAATQISLIITSVFGVKGRMHETHCHLHAIVLHYSWLASLCWMNTCCVHMYRVFTSFRGPSAWSETKTHRHYCLYSFGLPFIIVTVTVITTYVTTNGASTGYNKDICLPDVSISPLISILAILTPFFITITVNAVLFIRTVKEIVQVTRLQQNTVSTRSKKGVITYFKLSTITGVFWSLEAAAVLTNNPVFILIATPFAALQGLFIFASFMVNKTVHDLYMGLAHFTDSSSEHSRNRTLRSVISGGSSRRIPETNTSSA